jgi:hypothetical protein
MGLGRFIHRAAHKVERAAKGAVNAVGKTADRVGHQFDRSAKQFGNFVKRTGVLSQFGVSKGGGGSDPGAASYTQNMQDVARSRAAGSGVVNYTDRTPGGK